MACLLQEERLFLFPRAGMPQEGTVIRSAYDQGRKDGDRTALPTIQSQSHVSPQPACRPGGSPPQVELWEAGSSHVPSPPDSQSLLLPFFREGKPAGLQGMSLLIQNSAHLGPHMGCEGPLLPLRHLVSSVPAAAPHFRSEPFRPLGPCLVSVPRKEKERLSVTPPSEGPAEHREATEAP